MTDWFDDVIKETAVAQGLPSTVNDESALDRLATLLASATPDRSSALRRGAVERPGIGAAGTSPRATELRGSGSTAARALTSASARRSTSKKKAGVAATTPAPNTSTPVEGVRRQA